MQIATAVASAADISGQRFRNIHLPDAGKHQYELDIHSSGDLFTEYLNPSGPRIGHAVVPSLPEGRWIHVRVDLALESPAKMKVMLDDATVVDTNLTYAGGGEPYISAGLSYVGDTEASLVVDNVAVRDSCF